MNEYLKTALVRAADLPRILHDETNRRIRIGVFICAAASFTALACAAHDLPYFSADLAIRDAILRTNNSVVNELMRAVSLIGDGWVPHALSLVTALLVLILSGWRDSVTILLATLGGSVANVLVKLAVVRPRPLGTPLDVYMPYDWTSFPSGHVTFSVCYFGCVAYIVIQRTANSRFRFAIVVAACTLVTLMGWSRISLNVHYPSDVFGSLLLGSLWLSLSVAVLARLNRRVSRGLMSRRLLCILG